jgi:threonine/homoserine/homoserine lactone efflux protein
LLETLLAALTFGLTAGLKPGPLSIFVIHQTLSHGLRAGIIASLAPFASDGPIIIASYYIISNFKQFDLFIATLSIVGAAFLAFIAIRLLIKDVEPDSESSSPASFATAVKLNLLNPAPYIFWGTVGGVYMTQGTLAAGLSFIIIFLLTLSATKILLAGSLRALGSRFSRRAYHYLLKTLSIVLLLFAGNLLLQGIRLL